MRWVDGDRSEQRVDFTLKVSLRKSASLFIEFVPLQKADALFA